VHANHLLGALGDGGNGDEIDDVFRRQMASAGAYWSGHGEFAA
jgi:hypothetical protein